MKSSKISLAFSRVLVVSLSICLLCVHSLSASGLPAKSISAAEISVSGPNENGEKPFVLINDDRAFSGRTFISNGTISTTETSSATISLGKLGRVDLAPASTLNLSFSDGRIAGVLSKGTVNVSNTDGVAVAISTPGDTVTNEEASASQFSVTVVGTETGVNVENGRVRSNNGSIPKQDDDDDDDDDHWKAWVWVGVIGGAIATILIVRAINDDDDDVSPTR